ncbi:helix-turn-helix transcriptional regulator [Pseudochrobactrum sp. Wa41.01b-1]|uniref:helix-turn-helix transcriptional regulator n=1 Tax=Pseudochrobactrum sp. Wa41.01b-1 TaxID=2864102 RepID=UPI00351D2E60
MSKNISQEELALLAGVERAYVGHIERGKKNPTILTIEKLVVALGCEAYELFSNEYIDNLDVKPLKGGRKK